jgi:DNA-binding NarL/FixJ family response regulator
MAMPYSLTLVAIHPRELVRLGLIFVFESSSGIKVVGQGSTAKDAQKVIKQRPPDIVLLYDQLDDGDSFDLVKKLIESNPDLKILMLGLEESPTRFAQAAAAGAHDYLFEGSSSREILDAVKRAVVGKPPTTTSSYGKVRASMQDRSSNPAVDLTPRELQVLRHIGYGLSNEEIARSMEISIDTVKEHVQNLLRKMGVKDRTQAAVWVVREGLV